MGRLRIGVLVSVSWLSACSSGSNQGTPSEVDSGSPTDGTTGETGPSGKKVPCDVEGILDRWATPGPDASIVGCRSCHAASPKFGAPMSLMTYDDLVAPAPSNKSKKVYELIGARIHDDAKPMPQPPNPRLTAGETATLDAWIGAGAPERGTGIECGTPDGGPTDSGPPKPLSCTPDLTLTTATPWTMPTDTSDIYVCYGVDVAVTGKRHITAIVPKIDNTKIVHHILLMQSDSKVDPTPTKCDFSAIARDRMLYGWAPGGKYFELPPEAGFLQTGTMHYMVQIHYNNLKKLVGEKDSSGFAMCTTDKLRPNEADVLAFGSTKFTIPAKGKLDWVCNLPVSSLPPIHVIGAFPHMHQIGKRISTVLHRKSDGKTIDLGNVPAWDFNTQVWFPMADILVQNGDNVETNCYWENPTGSDVSWGENTANEMCYSFTMYYPKITLPVWSWQLPATIAGCGAR